MGTMGLNAIHGMFISWMGFSNTILAPLFSPLGYWPDQLWVMIWKTSLVDISLFTFLFGNNYLSAFSLDWDVFVQSLMLEFNVKSVFKVIISLVNQVIIF